MSSSSPCPSSEPSSQKNARYCHLSVRTEFSLIEGSLRIDDLLDKIVSLGHTHVGLSDHGALFGALEFYKKCRHRSLIPIIGCTLYIEPSPEVMKALKNPKFNLVKDNQKTFHLTLLAKNYHGYGNLIRLVSDAYNEGLTTNDLPICSWSLLSRHLTTSSSHLVALSGACMGEFYYLQRLRHHFRTQSLHEEASTVSELLEASLEHHLKFFPRDDFYCELVDHHLGFEQKINAELFSWAQDHKLLSVATADAYYASPEDSYTHTLALAIKNSLTESEISRRNRSGVFHLLDEDEFCHTFKDYPQAIAETLKIAEKCSHLEIPLSHSHLPSFPLEKGQDENSLLVELSEEGLREKLQHSQNLTCQPSTYQERLTFEIQVIQDMGFSGYFLIVQDFVRWARSQDIAVGPGRGSGAGSLVAYCLGITHIDPLRWGLIFERFLNPERVSLPDFDIDFCQWRREEVIDYVSEKYGATHVAHIGTYGKMMAKAAIKNVARVLGINYSKMNHITKMFPLDPSLTIPEILQQYPEIAKAIDEQNDMDQVVKEATKLEGMVSHTSVHPAGVVIADKPINHYAPTFRTSRDPAVMSQYEMKALEQVGLVKFDFLGLKTLTVLDKACELIRKEHPDFELDHIPLDDAKVYQSLSSGHTVGIFQAESHGMTALAHKLKPSRFEDIIALVALFRPGPLGSGMVDDFIERKHLRQKITYLHPLLEPILEETYGMIVYQEQVQKIAAALARYSLAEADLLRRAMGKKIPEEMKKQKERFIQGTAEQEISQELATKIFDLMSEFAKYGFNKSHSAAYGLLLYQTAYLKYHHPEAYMIGIMSCDMDHPKKLRSYIEECRRMQISVQPPCLQNSQGDFSSKGEKNIVFALEAIKGIGKKTAQIITQERENGGAYGSPLDLAHRLDLNTVGKKNLELLITAGALDGFSYRRESLLSILGEWVLYSQKHHQQKHLGQGNLFQLMAIQTPETHSSTDQLPTPKWYQKLQSLPQPSTYPISYHELIQERSLTGTFLSAHPMDLYLEETEFLAPKLTLKEVCERIKKLKQAPSSPPHNSHSSEEISCVAFLTEQYVKTTQNGKLMANLRFEDSHNSLEALMFEKDLKEHTPLPSSDNYVTLTGHLRGGERATLIVKTIKVTAEVLVPKTQRLIFNFDLGAKEACALFSSPAQWEAPPPIKGLEPLLGKLKQYSTKFPGSVELFLRLSTPRRNITWNLCLSCSINKHFITLKSQLPCHTNLIYKEKKAYREPLEPSLSLPSQPRPSL